MLFPNKFKVSMFSTLTEVNSNLFSPSQESVTTLKGLWKRSRNVPNAVFTSCNSPSKLTCKGTHNLSAFQRYLWGALASSLSLWLLWVALTATPPQSTILTLLQVIPNTWGQRVQELHSARYFNLPRQEGKMRDFLIGLKIHTSLSKLQKTNAHCVKGRKGITHTLTGI